MNPGPRSSVGCRGWAYQTGDSLGRPRAPREGRLGFLKVVLTHEFELDDADRLRTLVPAADIQLAAADALAAQLEDADAVLCFRLRPEDVARTRRLRLVQ